MEGKIIKILSLPGAVGGQVDSIQGGNEIGIDNSDPINPIINFTGIHFTPTSLLVDYGFIDNSTNWNEAYSWGDHSGLYDDYQSWNLKTNGIQRTTVQSGGDLDLVAGTNITLGYSAGGVVTINAAGGAVGGQVNTVVGGTDITVDNTDPINPIVNFDGGYLQASTQGVNRVPFFNATTDLVDTDSTFVYDGSRLGIGTTTPDTDTTLNIETSGLVGARITMSNTSNGAHAIDFNRTSTNVQSGFNWSTAGIRKWNLGTDNSVNEDLWLYAEPTGFIGRFYSNGDIMFGNQASEILFIDFNNGIGVGTSTVTEAITTDGYVLGLGYKIPSGLSTQFLKADGTVDSSTYLTSFTETDPIFVASDVYGVTTADITNWNTAFGWGDHGTVGYLESVVAGTNVTIDNTDPVNPIISAVSTGVGVQLEWKFDTATTASSPSNKEFRYNNSDPSLVTEIYINDNTNNGADASTILDALVVGNRLYIQTVNDGDEYLLATIDSAITDNTGWFTIPVSVDDYGILPSNNRVCGFIITIGSATYGVTPTGFELITESTNDGWRLIGRNPNLYGSIGEGAICGTHSSTTSSTIGATGNYSFSANAFNIASGLYSSAFGGGTTASNDGAFSIGNASEATGKYSFAGSANCIASGDYSFAIGHLSKAQGNYSLAHGEDVLAQNNYQASFGLFNRGSDSDTVFEVGIGTADLVRKNGLEVTTAGEVVARELTDTVIDNEGSGRVLITRSYFNKNFKLGTKSAISSSSSLTMSGSDLNFLGGVDMERVNITARIQYHSSNDPVKDLRAVFEIIWSTTETSSVFLMSANSVGTDNWDASTMFFKSSGDTVTSIKVTVLNADNTTAVICTNMKLIVEGKAI